MKEKSIDAVLLCVCDQPYLTAALLRRMVKRFAAGRHSIVACRYGDVVGVPALFDRKWFAALLNLDPSHGAKNIIKQNFADVAVAAFPKGNFDIDTEKDYTRLMQDAS